MAKWKKQKQPRRERQESRAGDGTRSVRLQELIREEVNFLLRGDVRDPRLQRLIITMVELSPDGSRARLWFTNDDDADDPAGGGASQAPPDDHQVIAALDRAAGFLRSELAENLGLKRTPELRFRRDPATHALPPDPPAPPTHD